MELEKECLKLHVPFIRKDTAMFLKTLLLSVQPKKILEIGTGIGFSAYLMSSILNKNASIFTVEHRHDWAEKAAFHLEKQQQVKVIEEDAFKYLETITEQFDFIFLDAAKGQYLGLLPNLLQHLRGGGILLADDIFHNGNIIKDRMQVKRRQRTIYGRMHSFLDEIMNNPLLSTALLDVGEGLSFSVKQSQNATHEHKERLHRKECKNE